MKISYKSFYLSRLLGLQSLIKSIVRPLKMNWRHLKPESEIVLLKNSKNKLRKQRRKKKLKDKVDWVLVD